ncbi:MAG: hypothetical protein PUB26_00520 [Mycoplasmataceae bacterium]|nr:hypothetical protein [Mycoplasmataceae bacterium]
MEYFKILPCKKGKLYKNFTRDFEIADQFKSINDSYQEFLSFYDKKWKDAIEYGLNNLKYKRNFVLLGKLKEYYNTVLKIMKYCNDDIISFNSYFKLNTRVKISRRMFFKLKKKLCDMCDKHIWNYCLHSPKSKINKIIWYIYDESIRRKICNYYYKKIDDSSKYFNRTNIWFKVSKEDILNLDNKLINYPTKHSSKF